MISIHEQLGQLKSQKIDFASHLLGSFRVTVQQIDAASGEIGTTTGGGVPGDQTGAA